MDESRTIPAMLPKTKRVWSVVSGGRVCVAKGREFDRRREDLRFVKMKNEWKWKKRIWREMDLKDSVAVPLQLFWRERILLIPTC